MLDARTALLAVKDLQAWYGEFSYSSRRFI